MAEVRQTYVPYEVVQVRGPINLGHEPAKRLAPDGAEELSAGGRGHLSQ